MTSDSAVDALSVDPAVPAAPAAPQTARRRRRQRRPSGAPPPLPRAIGATGKFWLAALALVAVVSSIATAHAPWRSLGDHSDTLVLRVIAVARMGWLTHLMRAIKAGGSGYSFTVLGLGTVAALAVFRRWRHLLAMLGSLGLLVLIGGKQYDLVARPRPYGVRIIGGWGGFSMPSPPVAVLALVLVSIAYTLVVPGRPRWFAKVAIAVILLVFGFSRLYLAVDHPSDVLFGIILGVAIPVTVFRLFTPNEVFPVVYRRGRAAHLDVTGRRGQAIRDAVRDQLGLTVLDIKPVGLEGSGGSTPLQLKVEGEPDTYLFAKLYARSHVRADRWYKLYRTIRSGSLEDEASFQTVRRFVEYEDYTLRLMQDMGIPVPAPYGVVEITPEREYMLLMEFFDGAREIGEAEVDDDVIDEGLGLVRQLWDAGLAHRDIKPANLMVRDGKVLLIDAFFVQVRPSPWRQAVDLGNMMLVLAVRTDPDRVYRRALRYFTPDEIAEAFAATRGVASPTQLRAHVKRDGRDLLARFRMLAPPRRPVVIQRWSVKRIALIVAMPLLFTLGIVNAVAVFLPAQNLEISVSPECKANPATILMAQAVPSAELLPCIALLPSGWSFGTIDVHSGRVTFSLDSDRAGERAILVTLSSRCRVRPNQEYPTDEPGTRRYEESRSLLPRFEDLRTYTFAGGCVTYLFSFAPGAPATMAFDAGEAIGFVPRTEMVRFVREMEDLSLCGAGAPCPE